MLPRVICRKYSFCSSCSLLTRPGSAPRSRSTCGKRTRRARQIGERDPLAFADDHRVLDDVVELPYVALPRLRQQQLQRAVVDALERALELAPVALDQEVDQRGNVLAPLAQRRQMDVDHV